MSRSELFNSPKKNWLSIMFEMLIKEGAFANMTDDEKEQFLKIKVSVA